MRCLLGTFDNVDPSDKTGNLENRKRKDIFDELL